MKEIIKDFGISKVIGNLVKYLKKFQETSLKYWKTLIKSGRTYPKGKGKQILYAEWEDIEGKLEYIPSRKIVYIPEYYNLVKDRELTKYWIEEFSKGDINIIVYDYDGPKKEDGTPDIKEVNKKLLIKMINEPKYPFGHGYIIAGAIMGIYPNEYC